MRQHPSAKTKVNPCAWRRRTRAVRSDASEARSGAREAPTDADPAKRKKRRARCTCQSRQHWKAFSPGLTPELSRAAKRRRLGRIVRTDVTAEAAEPQAATPRMTREPLTESRATRGPRLEKPKPERRPAEARTLVSEGATACTARRDDTRARKRRSTHALGGGAPALSEAMRPKREAQRANHRPTPTQQKCENAERD